MATQSQECKKALKQAFPGVKFSVTSRHTSSINIRWTDGPRKKEVEAVASQWESVSRCDYTGEILSGGNTFVFCERTISDSLHNEYREMLEKDGALNDGDEPAPQWEQDRRINWLINGEGWYSPCGITHRTQEQLDARKLNDQEVVAAETEHHPEVRLSEDVYHPGKFWVRSFVNGEMTTDHWSNCCRDSWEEAMEVVAHVCSNPETKECPTAQSTTLEEEYFTTALSDHSEQQGDIAQALHNLHSSSQGEYGVRIHVEEVLIQSVVKMSVRDYDRFCYNFQVSRDWLKGFGGDGNHSTQLEDAKDYDHACRNWSRGQWEEYRRTSYIGVVAITDGARLIYADPRGSWDHAEVVVFPEKHTVEKVLTDLGVYGIYESPKQLDSGHAAPFTYVETSAEIIDLGMVEIIKEEPVKALSLQAVTKNEPIYTIITEAPPMISTTITTPQQELKQKLDDLDTSKLNAEQIAAILGALA